ncbi:hypothetical protein D917_01492 [Trichinella nativa]|uniref:Uncharacterized protein n=1 Tax=Trichinella nativa TaxID=6335 RepID=A0A1Y3EVQ5_9BILA|nr:hypothetical protein D917_01492 [Trichinella nativa]
MTSWSTTAHARPATMMLINLFSRLFMSSKQFGVEGSGRKAQGDFWPTLGKTSRLISAASISLSILPLNYF